MKQFIEINPNLSYRKSLVKGTQFLYITDAIEYEKKRSIYTKDCRKLG